MDSYTLATLLGGLGGTLIGWGMIYIFYMIRRRRGAAGIRRLVHDEEFSPMFGRPVTDWERVFIWKPVHTVDRGMVWPMQFVWRRRIAKKAHLDGGSDFWFQYAKVLRFVGI